MPITLTGSGGLFTRLGQILGMLNHVNTFRGDGVLTGLQSIGAGMGNIDTEMSAGSPTIGVQTLNDGVFTARDQARTGNDALTSYLQTLFQNLIIQMATDVYKLQSPTLAAAIDKVMDDMVTGDNYVTAPTVSVGTITAGSSNNGTQVVVCSVKRPDTMVAKAYVRDEDLLVTCIADEQSGGTEGQETWTVVGETAREDELFYDWPLGSGVSTTLTAVDASTDAGTNLLTNSDFEDWTAAVPDNWAVETGASTITAAGSSDAYDGDDALEITSDGATLTAITQTFDDTDGTTSEIEPLTCYAVNCRMKTDDNTATGTFKIQLYDGSSVINGPDGNPAEISVNVADLTTSYQALSSLVSHPFLYTPRVLPATVKLRLKITTAVSNGDHIFLDDLAMTPATEIYPGGPQVAVFSGATKSVIDDYHTIPINNDHGGGWQKGFERMCDMTGLNLQLRSSGANLINDNLIG